MSRTTLCDLVALAVLNGGRIPAPADPIGTDPTAIAETALAGAGRMYASRTIELERIPYSEMQRAPRDCYRYDPDAVGICDCGNAKCRGNR